MLSFFQRLFKFLSFSILILFIHLIAFQIVKASQIFDPNLSVRALGMGNAYTAIVNNGDSMFYNPAGIAKNAGIYWRVFDITAGANGLEILDTIEDLQDSSGFESAVRELYGDHVFVNAQASSTVLLPYFGLAVYDHLNASLDIRNPVYPNFDVQVTNDFGYAIGLGGNIIPEIGIGIVVKRIDRTGSRVPLGPSFVATLDPDTIQNEIEKKGTGYGLDLGVNLMLDTPINPTVSFVWRNVGGITYTPEDGLEAPTSDQDEMIIGLGFDLDAGIAAVRPVFDFRFLNRSEIQLAKKIHLGVEIDLPILDLRAGFHQGYYTLGAGMNLGILRVEAATYGVELGEAPGQREDRRYVLSLTMEFGFDTSFSFLGITSGQTGGKGRGGSGGRKLKQRR